MKKTVYLKIPLSYFAMSRVNSHNSNFLNFSFACSNSTLSSRDFRIISLSIYIGDHYMYKLAQPVPADCTQGIITQVFYFKATGSKQVSIYIKPMTELN